MLENKQTIGKGSFFEFPSPVMGGEDFSYLLQKVPGVMAFLGVCPEDISDSLSAPPCHSNRMRISESALLYGVALHTAVALEGVPFFIIPVPVGVPVNAGLARLAFKSKAV